MRFYYLALISVLFISGCGSSKPKEQESNHTTHTLQKPKILQKQSNDAVLKFDTNASIEISPKAIKTNNICQNKQTIIINIFAPWYKLSISQLQTLDKLKQDDLCIISIAIDSDSNTSLPNRYKISHKVIFGLQNNKFVDKITKIINIDKNFKLPMSIIYKNNTYIDNYQGLMPIEMLNYIIKDQ